MIPTGLTKFWMMAVEQLNGGSYPEIPFTGYAEGTFQLNFSKTTHQDLDTYTSSLNGQITLKRKSKSLPPAAYRAVYDQLSPSLK